MEPRRKGVESDVEDTQRGQYQTELQQVLFRGFMAFEQSGELSRFGVGVELSRCQFTAAAFLALLAWSSNAASERYPCKAQFLRLRGCDVHFVHIQMKEFESPPADQLRILLAKLLSSEA